jgi:hypothetical protein
MPKVVVNAFLTLDGVMQAPGGPDEDPEGGFVHGGWQAPYIDDVLGRLVIEGIADADGFLLGRKTYDIFANYWNRWSRSRVVRVGRTTGSSVAVSRSTDRWGLSSPCNSRSVNPSAPPRVRDRGSPRRLRTPT